MTSVTAPNFTQLPNIFFDFWMSALSGGEFKVLCAIARKTFGWHKQKDQISNRQICDMTGLTPKGVREILLVLLLHGLIDIYTVKCSNGGDDSNLYAIRVDDENQPPWAKQLAMEAKQEKQKKENDNTEQHPPRTSGTTPPRTSGTPQKKDLTKETTTTTSEEAEPPPTKKEKVVVFPCLEKIQISQELKERLRAMRTEEELSVAVTRCLAWKSRANDEVGILAVLKKGEDWNDVDDPNEIWAKNFPFLQSLAKYDGTNIGPISITVGYRYIEFAGNMKSETFTIDQKDFIHLVNAHLQKLGRIH